MYCRFIECATQARKWPKLNHHSTQHHEAQRFVSPAQNALELSWFKATSTDLLLRRSYMTSQNPSALDSVPSSFWQHALTLPTRSLCYLCQCPCVAQILLSAHPSWLNLSNFLFSCRRLISRRLPPSPVAVCRSLPTPPSAAQWVRRQ